VVDPPRVFIEPDKAGFDRVAKLPATSGAPGAGYWNVCSCSPKPKRSWIVLGFAIAVTAVTAVTAEYQCADTTRTARGRGNVAARARHDFVKRLSSSVLTGLPCPMNAAGINVDVVVTNGSVSPPDA
jgi:hypothetical protein